MHTLISMLKRFLINQNVFVPNLSAIILAALTLPLIAIYGAESFIKDNRSYLAYSNQTSNDIRAHQSVSLLNQKAHKTTVFNIGGSGLLRAINDESILESKWSQSINFLNFSYGGQSMAESFMIIQKLPIKKSDIIFLHTSISRINRTKLDKGRACQPYLYSIYYRDVVSTLKELNLPAPKASILCKFTLFSKWKVIRNIIVNRYINKGMAPPLTFRGIYPLEVDINNAALIKRRARIITAQKDIWFAKRWLELNPEAAKKFTNIVIQISDYIKSRGATLILLDPPQSEVWFKRYHSHMDSPYLSQYKQLFSSLEKRNITYYDLRHSPVFKYNDFYDHQHMLQVGRDKFSPMYHEMISTALKR